MPDNVTLNEKTSTGETIRTVRKSSIQHPVSILDVGTHPDDNSGASSLVSKADNVGMPVEGLSNSGTVSQGAPVLVGAKYLSTIPENLTDTHAATLLVDSRNNLRTTLVGKNTDNGIAIDGSGAISVAGVATIDYDTLDPVEGNTNTDNTTCVGIVVPAAGGAAAVKSTSIQNTAAGVPAAAVVGLNTSQIGSFFFDGHTGASDTTNVAAFGIAIASSSGPKAVGTDGTTTTYLPVSLENSIVSDFDTDDSDPELASEISNGLAFGIAVPSSGGPAVVGDGSTTLPVSGSVAISSGSVNASVSGTVALGAGVNSGANIIGTVKLPDGETIVIQGKNGSTATDVAVDSDGHLKVDALTLPAITGWDYDDTSPVAHKMKVDAAGSVHITDVNTYVSDFDTDGSDPVNASSYGVVVPSSSGPVVVNGDADGLNTKAMALVSTGNESNLTGSQQLRVDSTGRLFVGGSILAQGNVYYYNRTYGVANAGLSAQYNPVDATSNGNLVLASDYGVGRTGTLDNLGIADSEPRVSLSGAIIDSTLEDLTRTVANGGPEHVDGDVVQLRVNDNGRLYVDVGDVNVVGLPTLPAGTNNIGDVDVASIASGSNLIGDVGIQGRTTGGLSMHSKLDYVNTPVDVKSSTGTVYGITVFNMTASPFYIKFYDETTSVNRAVHTPVLRFAVPANASSSGAGFVFNVPQGLAFTNQIQYAITTGVADTNTNGISSGNAVVNIAYK